MVPKACDVSGRIHTKQYRYRRQTDPPQDGLDADEVYQVALKTRPMETPAQAAADHAPHEHLTALHDLEDVRHPHILD